MSSYAVATLDQIEEIDDGRSPWRPVRMHFGIQSFGINAFTGKAAGDRLINEHDETDNDGHEELYLVHSGRARFEIDGETLDAPAGTMVFAPPEAKRTAFAEEAGTTLIALGGTPGKAYEAGGWELWAPINPLYEAGDYAGAADRARGVAEANPRLPLLMYNLACCESLAGRTDDAIGHLRSAIELKQEFREMATDDSDFDPVRDEDAFRQLVGT
jgi:hypothetical protein